jgi:quinol-cytochrome oxidoreductase complex cytochrome b subunit
LPESPGVWERIRSSDAWRSVFRHPDLDTPRGRALQSFSNVFLHVYPVKVPPQVLKLRYSFRLGFISTVLFVILLVTGVYLMFFYTPSITAAYGDMQRLKTSIGFGQLIRNVHRWSAHLMVLAVALHLVRVFWDGGYKAPRQFNWVIGVGLLVVTLAFSFTGYLLPWDQLSYWAVTVGSDLLHYVPLAGRQVRAFLLGGEEIGQATLLRFYVLHVAVLTAAFALLIVIHIWRVRKDGFAVRPEGAPSIPDVPVTTEGAAEDATRRLRLLGVVDRESVTAAARVPDDLVFTWPHLFVRHQVVALGTCALVLALGVAFAAPLQDYANPMLTPEPAKAPWYFVGLQELLAHLDPLIAGILVPVALGLGLVLLPYVDRNPAREPGRRKLAIVLFTLIMTLAVVLTVIGALFRGPGWQLVAPWTHLYLEM